MKVQVSSEYTKDSITLKTEFLDQGYEDHLHKVFVEICNLKDKATRESLIALGWTPPENKGIMTVPEGWKLVPREATQEMCNAAYTYGNTGGQLDPCYAYKAMLDAAPAPAQPTTPLNRAQAWRDSAQWLYNNYQDHPNITSLCDAMVEYGSKQ